MANYNNYIVFDFETGGRYPKKSQPTSLSAVAIDPVRLEIIKGSEFDSLIKPVFDIKDCEALGIEPLQDEAMNITGIKIEDLEKAPSLQEVWSRFTQHVSKYGKGNAKWSKPIACGYNIVNFDLVIVDKITERFGPRDKDRDCPDLFHPRDVVDVMTLVFQIFENNKNNRSISFDTVRNYFGLSKDGAHSSIVDVQQTALFLIRWMKWHRRAMPKNLEGSMKDVKLEDFYDTK